MGPNNSNNNNYKHVKKENNRVLNNICTLFLVSHCDESKKTRQLLCRLQYDREKKKGCLQNSIVASDITNESRGIEKKKSDSKKSSQQSARPRKIYIWLNAHKQDSLDPKFVFFSLWCRVPHSSHSIVQIRISLCNGTYQTHASYSTIEQQMKPLWDIQPVCIFVARIASRRASTNLLNHVIDETIFFSDTRGTILTDDIWYECRVRGIWAT